MVQLVVTVNPNLAREMDGIWRSSHPPMNRRSTYEVQTETDIPLVIYGEYVNS